MTGAIFPPLPPPLPKTAPLPLVPRSSPPPPLPVGVGAARAPQDDVKKAAPVSTPTKRKFGTVLTNSAAVNCSGGELFEPKKPVVDRDAASRRYYHQYKYTPRHGIQKAYVASGGRVCEPECEEQDKENAGPRDASAVKQAVEGELPLSAWDNYVHCHDGNDSSDASIWSVTPTELAESADTMRVSVKYPRGGRDLMFPKFYALPVFKTSRYCDEPAGTEETQEENRHATLSYQKGCTLSAESPSFVPQDTSWEDTSSEFMQMLKTSLTAKKVAPHMDWWPGDWKCKKCGACRWLEAQVANAAGLTCTHPSMTSSITKAIIEMCKRCRVGRFEDAGFVYAPPSVRQTVAA